MRVVTAVLILAGLALVYFGLTDLSRIYWVGATGHISREMKPSTLGGAAAVIAGSVFAVSGFRCPKCGKRYPAGFFGTPQSCGKCGVSFGEYAREQRELNKKLNGK
jgi:hypothetical protein